MHYQDPPSKGVRQLLAGISAVRLYITQFVCRSRRALCHKSSLIVLKRYAVLVSLSASQVSFLFVVKGLFTEYL